MVAMPTFHLFTGLEMTEVALNKTRAYFANLLRKVRSAMEKHKVDKLDVRDFLITFFEGDCHIPEDSNLRKIFDCITSTKLWRFDHYGPLLELTESFLPADDPARQNMTEYICQLSAFNATTRIIDYVKLSQLEEIEEDNQPFSPKTYNRKYRKLGVKLKVDNISETTLKYTHDIWKALKQQFTLPSLTAVVDQIMQGSLIITWLVLPHEVNRIKASISKSLDFFRQHNIIRIDLYGGKVILYNEEWMVSTLNTLSFEFSESPIFR